MVRNNNNISTVLNNQIVKIVIAGNDIDSKVKAYEQLFPNWRNETTFDMLQQQYIAVESPYNIQGVSIEPIYLHNKKINVWTVDSKADISTIINYSNCAQFIFWCGDDEIENDLKQQLNNSIQIINIKDNEESLINHL